MGAIGRIFKNLAGDDLIINSNKSWDCEFYIKDSKNNRIYIMKKDIPQIIEFLLEVDDWSDEAVSWSKMPKDSDENE